MADENCLHIGMFPWLALGHILPFLELSKCLAQRGHRISFISTPRNLQRLPKIPPNLAPLINLVSIPLPPIDNLPQHAEATVDISPDQGKLFRKAFDGLENPLKNFLEQSHPDWIFHDFAPHWLSPIAANLGISCAYFNIFNAAMVAFYGPSDEMIREDGGSRKNPEDFTVPPKWIPFPSNLALRFHEAPRFPTRVPLEGSGEPMPNVYRLGSVIRGCDFMAVRSCPEYEEELLRLLEEELCLKPVVPIGLLPPPTAQVSGGEDENWVPIRDWLNKQKNGSVVYIALGSESNLSRNELTELAMGLELSRLHFFWVLRKPPSLSSEENESALLPTGFEDRVKDRGVVCMGWAPQLKILGHKSVGGFLTHCGWSSVVEGLAFGLTLVMLPLTQPQALNARVLEGKKIGLEIIRDERDGSFTRDSVAESLRFVMVEEEGEPFRSKAKEMKEIFGDTDRHERYVDDFVRYLQEHRSPVRLRTVHEV